MGAYGVRASVKMNNPIPYTHSTSLPAVDGELLSCAEATRRCRCAANIDLLVYSREPRSPVRVGRPLGRALCTRRPCRFVFAAVNGQTSAHERHGRACRGRSTDSARRPGGSAFVRRFSSRVRRCALLNSLPSPANLMGRGHSIAFCSWPFAAVPVLTTHLVLRYARRRTLRLRHHRLRG